MKGRAVVRLLITKVVSVNIVLICNSISFTNNIYSVFNSSYFLVHNFLYLKTEEITYYKAYRDNALPFYLYETTFTILYENHSCHNVDNSDLEAMYYCIIYIWYAFQNLSDENNVYPRDKVHIQQNVTIYAMIMHKCMVCTKGYMLYVNRIVRKGLFINLCDGVPTHWATGVS